MRTKILLVLAGVALSIVAETILGRLALSVTPFGRAVMRAGGATGVYADPLAATTAMLRLTTFALDPLIAAAVGLLVGLWGGERSWALAGLAMAPLALFAGFCYPVLWVGALGAGIDLLVASGVARITSTQRNKPASQTPRSD